MIIKKSIRKISLFCDIFFLIAILFISVFPQLIAPYEPQQMLSDILAPPSPQHLCGTDGLGRDMFTMLIYSTRMTFYSGLAIAAISGVIGITVGCIAGISNKFVDSLIAELINLFSIIPSVFIILLVAATGRIGFLQYVLVASFSFWTGTARIMRSQMLAAMEQPFIQNLLLLGERMYVIVIKHMIPNTIGPVVTNIALTVANACILECGLSYIGVNGLDYSLGQIMNHGEKYILSAWWITGFPIAVILLICVSILGIVNMTEAMRE